MYKYKYNRTITTSIYQSQSSRKSLHSNKKKKKHPHQKNIFRITLHQSSLTNPHLNTLHRIADKSPRAHARLTMVKSRDQSRSVSPIPTKHRRIAPCKTKKLASEKKKTRTRARVSSRACISLRRRPACILTTNLASFGCISELRQAWLEREREREQVWVMRMECVSAKSISDAATTTGCTSFAS